MLDCKMTLNTEKNMHKIEHTKVDLKHLKVRFIIKIFTIYVPKADISTVGSIMLLPNMIA